MFELRCESRKIQFFILQIKSNKSFIMWGNWFVREVKIISQVELFLILTSCNYWNIVQNAAMLLLLTFYTNTCENTILRSNKTRKEIVNK